MRNRKYQGQSLILKKAREKKWRDKHKLNGLCPCGKNKPIPGKAWCQECTDKSNNRRRKRRELRRRTGLCTECQKPANGKGGLCEQCYETYKSLVSRARKERIKNKVCVRCGKSPSIHLLKNCLVCTLKCLAYDVWEDRKRWKELLDLFDQQNGKCPYLKEPITIGLNASLDHRIPKKLGGTNELSNLQWVHKAINTMKWDLTEEQFLFYVQKIHTPCQEQI